MITTRVFHKEIPSVDGEIFRFIGGGALDSSLTIVLENESEANSLIYKIQESSDGETWVDKELPTGVGTSISFTVGTQAAHTIKLPNTSTFYRMVARGTLTANIGLMWYTTVSTASGSAPTLLA